MAMLVRDVMKKKVVTIPLSAHFPEIIKVLTKNGISGAPVVNKEGKIVGVISEKDLFYKLFPSEKKFYKNVEYYMNHENIVKDIPRVLKLKARHFMSKDVISIGPEEHILTACSLFLVNSIRRLPVVEDGKMVGIITTNNIYKNFLMSLLKK